MGLFYSEWNSTESNHEEIYTGFSETDISKQSGVHSDKRIAYTTSHIIRLAITKRLVGETVEKDDRGGPYFDRSEMYLCFSLICHETQTTETDRPSAPYES